MLEQYVFTIDRACVSNWLPFSRVIRTQMIHFI